MHPSTATSVKAEFGPIRNFLWPIHHHELKKLVPMFCMFFLVSFIYNLLRCMKVALILKAPTSGPEVLPYLKIGAVLPGAIFLTYLFAKLISRFNRDQVFYMFLWGFLAYFAAFLFLLYPQHEYLQLDKLADFLDAHVLDGFHGLIIAMRHLNLTVFYVLSELWSAIMLSVLLWGFANEVTELDEAKRFYATFALSANFSGILSGQVATLIKRLPYIQALPYSQENQWVFLQLIVVLLVGALIAAIYYYLTNYVYHEYKKANFNIKLKQKLSLSECISYSLRSEYILCIIMIVVGYNIVYNLTDFMWTNKANELLTQSKDLNVYMNNVTSATSIVAVILALFVSGNVIRFYGWKPAALITPIIWGISSFGFFGCLNLEISQYADVLYYFAANPANFVLLLGSLQIAFGRACKYTVFDESKEIAFIPLSKEQQRKAKAVVDGIATRFGKSGGALIIISLLVVCGNDINRIIPYVSVLLVLVLALWIFSVVKLGNMVSVLDKKASEDIIKAQELTINTVVN